MRWKNLRCDSPDLLQLYLAVPRSATLTPAQVESRNYQTTYAKTVRLRREPCQLENNIHSLQKQLVLTFFQPELISFGSNSSPERTHSTVVLAAFPHVVREEIVLPQTRIARKATCCTTKRNVTVQLVTLLANRTSNKK